MCNKGCSFVILYGYHKIYLCIDVAHSIGADVTRDVGDT